MVFNFFCGIDTGDKNYDISMVSNILTLFKGKITIL